MTTTSIVVDIIRAFTSNRSAFKIAEKFAEYCSLCFNDSVLAQDWEQFSVNHLQQKNMEKNVLQNSEPAKKQQDLPSLNIQDTNEQDLNLKYIKAFNSDKLFCPDFTD